MTRLRGFPRRFRFPWRTATQIRRDVDDELAFHLAMKIEALERQGLTADEAREEALRGFGDLEAARKTIVAEDHRGERQALRLMMLDDLVRDTRLAWRSLRRTPEFTVVAVLVLALGIGVVAGTFSLVNVVALKPVLSEEPGELRGVFAVHPVLREMMRESVVLTGIGLAVGLVLALAIGQVLGFMIYDVGPADPWALLGATACLALAASLASWLPVRSALRIGPRRGIALRVTGRDSSAGHATGVESRLERYSYRSTVIGSMRDARRSGT